MATMKIEKKCERCGAVRQALHKHHKIPRSRGGDDSPSNLEKLCANCHEDEHGGSHGGYLAHEGAAIEKQRAANLRSWRDPVRKARRLIANSKGRTFRSTPSKWIEKDYERLGGVLARRYKQSNAHLDRAIKVTPGAAQTMSKSPQCFPVGVFPLFAAGGKGSRLIDVDGNEYIDWICALGAVTLGYSYEPMIKAVSELYGSGGSFGLPTRLEQAAADAIIEAMPSAEAVRFAASGTEACMAAVRIARRATGRKIVVTTRGSYHGWADWYIASRVEHLGVPDEMSALIRVCDYDDISSMRELIDDDVACVIMEPTLMTEPSHGYLGAVCNLARSRGALVIWDEMILGYRLAIGGASEFYHEKPDLATYGKGMGNGAPIACVVGRRDVMAYADVISGTFLGHAPSLAAALVVLETYRTEPVISRLHFVGHQLQSAYNEMAAGFALPTKCIGPCWHPKIQWDCAEKDLAMALFLQETARRGVLFHPSGFNTSYAFSEDDVRLSVDACWKTLLAMKRGDWKKMFKGQVMTEKSWRDRSAMTLTSSQPRLVTV